MLDIVTIHSGIESGERYYTEEESYYSEDEEIQAITKSEWFGNMAPNEPYSAERFTEFFYGNLPNGRRMRGDVLGDGKERLGFDLTFAVPGKSLSMQIHAPDGDKRLWRAHIEAVKEVMAIAEERYAASRVQVNGDRQVIKTGNIAACLVNHHESRAGDPHVHTHVVLFNSTHCPDGEHRALYKELLSKSGILGDIYHQKLALKVQALGYEIEETKEGFELAGTTEAQRELFSKRSTEIDDYLKAKGWDKTPQNRQRAVFETRMAKDKSQTLEQKQDRWGSEMAAVGFTGLTPANQPITPKNQETPRELLDAAIGHLSERQSSFSHEDIQRFVFSHLRSFDEKPLNQEIDTHPDLLDAWDGRYTTQTAVDRDLRIIGNWLQGNDSVKPLNPNADFSHTILNSGQSEAMERLLSSPDQYQILKGLAGTGKTTALGIAREQLPPETVIKVFAATHNAKNAIAESFDLEGATIAQLAVSEPTTEPNQLWILDESGMVGSEDFEMVMNKAAKVGARVWAVGDTGQNGAIAVGAPVRMLMHSGATVHKLRDIIRQQNKEQRTAVKQIFNQTKECFNDQLKGLTHAQKHILVFCRCSSHRIADRSGHQSTSTDQRGYRLEQVRNPWRGYLEVSQRIQQQLASAYQRIRGFGSKLNQWRGNTQFYLAKVFEDLEIGHGNSPPRPPTDRKDGFSLETNYFPFRGIKMHLATYLALACLFMFGLFIAPQLSNQPNHLMASVSHTNTNTQEYLLELESL